MNLSIYPTNDTIEVGDTLWVEIRTENPILNQWNNKTYDISNARFMTYIGVNDLMMPNIMPVGGYKTINEHGNTDSISGKIVLKKDTDGTLYWKQGFVMMTRGLYLFQLVNDPVSPSEINITQCKNANLEMTYILNGDSTADASNYYLLQHSLDENVRNYSQEQVAKAGVYAVCVN